MTLRHLLPTIFLYTEEQRGNQLVESEVFGIFSDVAGIDKLVVVHDPHNRLTFVYRVDHDSDNLDAVGMTQLDSTAFDGKQSTSINGLTYRLGPPSAALRLLRDKPRWIQDKGSVLGVLLQNAAVRSSRLTLRRIPRPRVTRIPPDAPIVRLPSGPDADT